MSTNLNELKIMIKKNLERKINGEYSIDELLTDEFISRKTSYTSLNGLLENNNITIEDLSSKDNSIIDRVNQTLNVCSSFKNFDQMILDAKNFLVDKELKKAGFEKE